MGTQEGGLLNGSVAISSSILTTANEILCVCICRNKAHGLHCVTLSFITYLEISLDSIVATWKLVSQLEILSESISADESLLISLRSQKGGYLTFVCWLICLRNLT